MFEGVQVAEIVGLLTEPNASIPLVVGARTSCCQPALEPEPRSYPSSPSPLHCSPFDPCLRAAAYSSSPQVDAADRFSAALKSLQQPFSARSFTLQLQRVPYSCEIVFSSLMGFWSSIKCLLSSPFYICIIINFMVLLIAATSTVHNQDDHNNDHDHHQNKVIDFDDDHDLRIPESEPELEPVISSPPLPPAEIKKTLLLPAAAEPVKENEVEKSIIKENEEEDTMESTWKSITGEGKQKTKKKQLEKCETWDVPPLQNNNSISEEEPKMMMPSLAAPKRKELRKSETFNDSVSRACKGGLRRDPSTSLEEFNKQVEAFIKKFNDDMKLQRQESDQRFLDMVKKGL